MTQSLRDLAGRFTDDEIEAIRRERVEAYEMYAARREREYNE